MRFLCPVCQQSGPAEVTLQNPIDYEYGVVPPVPFRHLRCQKCGSEFLNPRPTHEMLAAFYPPDYHAYNEDHGLVAGILVTLRGRARARHYVSMFAGPQGRLFDVGTGDCRHFDDLRRYCDVYCAGVEINPGMVERARSLGYDVVQSTLEEFEIGSAAGSFDIVSMNHLLEHVVQPDVVFRKTFELLRPGGHVIGQLPCATSWEHRLFGMRWAGYHFPRHLQAITPAGLSEGLQRAGFEDIEVSSALHLQSALSLQNAIVSLGYGGRLLFGKVWFYNLLLLAVAPFEAVAFLAGQGGIMNFRAKRPEADHVAAQGSQPTRRSSQ